MQSSFTVEPVKSNGFIDGDTIESMDSIEIYKNQVRKVCECMDKWKESDGLIDTTYAVQFSQWNQ